MVMVWVTGCWKEDMGGLGEVQHSGAGEVCGQRTNAQAAVDYAGLGVSIASHGAGIWPRSS